MLLHMMPLLLPVAAASGWVMARRSEKKKSSHQPHKLSRDYIVGLNFLLNEQPDKAVDTFINLLEVNGDTVETHLTLGNLFRRRGEVDRAIRIHQNLIARPQLETEQRVHALIELGRDYMYAGVFDRAERLFLEVVEIGADNTDISLKYLLDIYEQEKDWREAIKTAERLFAMGDISMDENIAQYNCQLAEEELSKQNLDIAYRYVKNALSVNRDSIRANLIFGKLETQSQRYKSAIKYFKKVIQQSPDYISEVLEPLSFCYQQLNAVSELFEYLNECLIQHAKLSVVLAISERIHETKGRETAIEFMTQQVKNRPSLKGISRLIELQLNHEHSHQHQELLLVQELVNFLIENNPIYQCEHCGFSAKKMHWHCPGCKRWDVVKPIQGIDGD